MIYNSTVCKRGSFLAVVPLGLMCTLQFNDKGILQRMWPNLDPTDNPDPDNILEQPLKTSTVVALEKAAVIPQRIQLPSSGPTLVKGVLYTKKDFFCQGNLPEVVFEPMIDDIAENPGDYSFYAGDIRNSGLRFNGAIAIRNRLEVLGFKLIPGYSITEDFSDTTFIRMLKSNKYPFPVPMFSGYMVFYNGNMAFYAPGFRQFTATKVESHIDKNGYIIADVYSSESGSDICEVSTSYTNVVKYNIQKGTSVILDNNSNVIATKPITADSRLKVKSEIECKVCGKKIKVMSKGYTECDDPHCQSKLYPEFMHFCNVLGLDILPFDKFISYVYEKKILCLTDIFTLDEYSKCKVKCTLSTLLSAMIPVSICSNTSFIQEFVARAGSPEAVDYYIKNPSDIEKDLKLSNVCLPKLERWLSDPYNVSTYETLVDMPEQVEIISVEKQFSGAPIFRNKVICITGKFKSGDYETITRILKSYSAEVVTQFNNRVSAVLVGHFRDEDASIIQLAKSYNKPIYKETEFFNAYEISKDINMSAV